MTRPTFEDLGLVNTKDMLKKAFDGGYAVPAYNFNNMEQLQAIIQACVETKSPVILQVSSGARKYANQTLLRYMPQGAVAYAKELGHEIPIAPFTLTMAIPLICVKTVLRWGFLLL